MRERIGLSSDGQSWIIKKFHGAIKVHENLPGHSVLAYLDTETTGLDPKTDTIIELGILVIKVNDESGRITEIMEEYSQFQDPGKPIPDNIVKLTGITDEMVAGKSINWETVNQILTASDVIVAHNAKFDRAFIDPKVPISADRIWACSMSQIDWSEKGYSCRSLSHLCMEHGFFYDSHRAVSDVKAAIHLLCHQSPDTNNPYLHEMLRKCREPELLVSAEGSPFETKELLKNKGFRWNAPKKVWQKRVNFQQKEEIQEFFDSQIYSMPGRGRFAEVSPKDRFKTEL